jgi:hypothetical protein
MLLTGTVVKAVSCSFSFVRDIPWMQRAGDTDVRCEVVLLDPRMGLWRSLLVTLRQGAWSKFAFAAHYIEDVYRLTFPPIEYAARRLNYLSVAAAAYFARSGTAVRMNNQLVDVPEDSLNQFTSGRGIIERNVIGNGV